MTKEEIKEMIDATINENGQGNITGKALNLALNSIVDAMGEGGGGLMFHYLPRYEISNLPDWEPDFQYKNELQECINHNIEVFETIMECNTNHIPIPGPIYFDTTFFEWNFNNREDSVRGGIAAAWRVYSNGDEPILFILSLANGDMREEIICNDGLFGEENQPE